jgi:ribose transport system permease protein
MKKDLGIFILLVVLCVAVAILNPRFLSGDNLQNTARLIGMYGIFSIGVGFVIITGGIDLSIGSVIALLGVLLSFLLVDYQISPILVVPIVLIAAAGLGLLHGILITRVNVQPFIVTLCGLLFYRGIARFVANDETRGFASGEGFEGLKAIATGTYLGLPAPFILLIIVAAVSWVLLHRTVFGRYLFAVGRNAEAARYSGIDSKKVIAAAYVLCAFLTGISAILVAFYTNSISPSSHGNFYELYAIAAAVLGGCSLRGGEGSIVGILLGTALLQVLQNLVNLLGIPSSLNFAVMGGVILIGVIADQMLKQRAARVNLSAG